MSPADRAELRVLLVEDEPANRALVRAIVARARLDSAVTLAEADTLAEARSALAGPPFDLVLVDVRLPDGTGLELVSELADSLPIERRPAVIVMSASVLPHEQSVALAAGVDGFLAKPYSPAELLEILRTATGSRQAPGPTGIRAPQ